MMQTPPRKKLANPADRWFQPAGMRFETLGPLSLSNNGEAVPLGGRKQRTLLAVLVLQRNKAVTRDHHLAGLVAKASAAAENGDYDAALRELTVALALWRGPAWGDLLDGEDLEADA